MGVFGEKHTSLTREQKRQLIHQADTHKLRPTEVCDWVLATWGLRIARVTVYSILHKQRASLMAGHKDLYQSMQNSVQALQQSSSNASSSSSSTNTYSVTEDACLERDPTTGRINKYQTTTAAGKRARSTSSSARSSSVMPDFSSMPPVPSGEGARWEGQLKRVREPASVELDRAMVQFLKSSAAVDEHGRRLNDAELQSHALRLARGIPSASRMRCSFGWLRHFKRRLGVQWAADRLGRHRWIVEMDPFGSSSVSASSETALSSSPLVSTLSSSTSVSATPTQTSADVAQPLVGPSKSALNRSRCQGKVAKDEHGNNNNTQSSQSHATPDQFTNNGSSSNEDNDDDDDEEEYHSSHELLGKEHDFTSPIPSSTTAINNNTIPFLASAKHTRSTSTSTSASTTSTSAAAYSHGSTLRHHAQTPLSNLDLHQQQQQQQHRLYSFGGNGSESSSFSSLGHFPSLHPSLASHSGLLNSYSTSLPSTTTPTHSHPTQHVHSHTSSILDSFPNLFDSLPPLHSPSSTIPTSTFPSSQLFLNHTSASIDTTSNKTSTTPSRMDASNPFGMNIDGGMRKVPSKDEAYDMLQSLLLYYEQDHHYIGEQQTLLLPRWIHQQRQIMSQSDESDPRLVWMRNTANATTSSTPSLSSSTSSPAPHPLSAQSLSHPHSNFPQHHHNYTNNSYQHHHLPSQQQQHYPRALSHTSSSPPLSPLSTASTSDPAGLEHFQLNSHDSSSIPTSTCTTTPTTASVGTSSFPSLTSSLEQQMFFAHQHALQQQFALHQQQQQQRQQQQQQQQQHNFVLSHQ